MGTETLTSTQALLEVCLSPVLPSWIDLVSLQCVCWMNLLWACFKSCFWTNLFCSWLDFLDLIYPFLVPETVGKSCYQHPAVLSSAPVGLCLQWRPCLCWIRPWLLACPFLGEQLPVVQCPDAGKGKPKPMTASLELCFSRVKPYRCFVVLVFQ